MASLLIFISKRRKKITTDLVAVLGCIKVDVESIMFDDT